MTTATTNDLPSILASIDTPSLFRLCDEIALLGRQLGKHTHGLVNEVHERILQPVIHARCSAADNGGEPDLSGIRISVATFNASEMDASRRLLMRVQTDDITRPLIEHLRSVLIAEHERRGGKPCKACSNWRPRA